MIFRSDKEDIFFAILGKLTRNFEKLAGFRKFLETVRPGWIDTLVDVEEFDASTLEELVYLPYPLDR